MATLTDVLEVLGNINVQVKLLGATADFLAKHERLAMEAVTAIMEEQGLDRQEDVLGLPGDIVLEEKSEAVLSSLKVLLSSPKGLPSSTE